MKRSVLAGIAAGLALAASGVAGVAVAAAGESLPQQAAAWQETASPTGWMPGANVSDGSRLSFITEHVARWLRPAECHPVSVGPTLAASLPTELQELLGFNQTSEYFGFIAGRSPSEWLKSLN